MENEETQKQDSGLPSRPLNCSTAVGTRTTPPLGFHWEDCSICKRPQMISDDETYGFLLCKNCRR